MAQVATKHLDSGLKKWGQMEEYPRHGECNPVGHVLCVWVKEGVGKHPRHKECNTVVVFLVPGSRGMRKYPRHEECDHIVVFFVSV